MKTIPEHSKPVPARKLFGGKRFRPLRTPYAGGLVRARKLIGERLLQKLQPDTNPIRHEEQPAQVNDDQMQQSVTSEHAQSGIEQADVASDQTPNLPQSEHDSSGSAPSRPKRAKMHKDDLEPYQ